MDDITAIGHYKKAEFISSLILEKMQQIGLTVNITKSLIFGLKANQISERNINIPIQRLQDINEWGSVILGSPIGSTEYRRNYCDKVVKEKSNDITDLLAIGLTPQTTFSILKLAINPRLAYITAIQGNIGLEAAKVFHCKIDDCILAVAQHSEENSIIDPDVIHLLRSLPLDQGGLGIIRHSWIQGPTMINRLNTKVVDFASNFFPNLKAYVQSKWNEVSLCI